MSEISITLIGIFKNGIRAVLLESSDEISKASLMIDVFSLYRILGE